MTREMGVSRLTGVVKRHKVAVVLTTVLALAAGLVWVKTRPYTYQARAVIRVDNPQPSREYVPPTLTEPSIERLPAVRRAIIARPIAATAAEKAGLLPANASESERNRLIDAMAARLDARVEGDDTFVLSYEDSNPARAQAFLAAVTEAYAALRTVQMGDQARNTAAYFASEVASLRPRVAEAEVDAEKYRLENYGSLPDQLEGNLRMMDETQMQIATLHVTLDGSLNRRRAIKAEALSPIRRQEESVLGKLTEARQRFAAGAPEVLLLEQELANVRNQRMSDEDELERRMERSPEMRAVTTEIERTRGTIDELAARKGELEKRIAAAAKIGEVLAKKSFERDVLRERLKSLMQRHEDAALAAGLETGVAGASRVIMVEPAWAGANPTKPSKPLYATIALLVAMALGLGFGILLDLITGRIRNPDQLRAVTGDVPLLGSVPRLTIVSNMNNVSDMNAQKGAVR